MSQPAHPTRPARLTDERRRAGWQRARRARLAAALALVVLAGACARKKPGDEDLEPAREPIAIHVKNENFLDMNVAVIASGVSRRLGLVTGNGTGDFTVAYSVTNGQSIYLTATPIGGSGRYVSQAISVGSGQAIEMRIASLLRQSTTVVRSP